MANDEHRPQLPQFGWGPTIAAWNDWRKQNPECHVDLSEARLEGANLSGLLAGVVVLPFPEIADVSLSRSFTAHGSSVFITVSSTGRPPP